MPIAVSVPPSLQKYKEHLRQFFEGMILKLDLNSHKDTPTTEALPDILAKLREEILEFEEQLKIDPTDENVFLELMDQANFSFLAFVAIRNKGVKTRREKLIDEFLSMDINNGKIYCKKSRAGAQYKVGQEIRGTQRNGYVDIKLQSQRLHGHGISIPRSHLIWYAATGHWPIGVVDHINRVKNDDRYQNLRDVTHSENNLNRGILQKYPPFVNQYKIRGREHTKNYGKFFYGKFYKGVNIRIGYYDTPEEAATKGKYQWDKKVAKMEELHV